MSIPLLYEVQLAIENAYTFEDGDFKFYVIASNPDEAEAKVRATVLADHEEWLGDAGDEKIAQMIAMEFVKVTDDDPNEMEDILKAASESTKEFIESFTKALMDARLILMREMGRIII